MSISHRTQAILLLTAYFGKLTDKEVKPLNPSEWGRFAQWLRKNAIDPESLILYDPVSILSEWHDRTITVERIHALLNRASVLGLVIEKWERAGLWILPRSEIYYPTRLKKLLKNNSPALFFGCGNQELLNKGGLAVVGSRGADAQDIAFTSQLGYEAAHQRVSIISGGARGVDEAAMIGSLENGGNAVGVLSDSLLRAATSAKFRDYLMMGNLILISPFNPEAGFDVGNAMSRNKYIYCLANAAVVIATAKGKGGTWNGAVENLKMHWVPLWVKRDQDKNLGNSSLVQQGAKWLPDEAVSFSTLFDASSDWQPEDLRNFTQISLLNNEQLEPLIHAIGESNTIIEEQALDGSELNQKDVQNTKDLSFYELFLYRLEQLASASPTTLEQLQKVMDVQKNQLNEWLKRAIAEGYTIKLNKPIRYQWLSFSSNQPSLYNHIYEMNEMNEK